MKIVMYTALTLIDFTDRHDNTLAYLIICSGC